MPILSQRMETINGLELDLDLCRFRQPADRILS